MIFRTDIGLSVSLLRVRRKGTIDFADATVFSSDNESGLFVVPIHLKNGNWVAAVWVIRGEFEKYRGIREL